MLSVVTEDDTDLVKLKARALEAMPLYYRSGVRPAARRVSRQLAVTLTRSRWRRKCLLAKWRLASLLLGTSVCLPSAVKLETAFCLG